MTWRDWLPPILARKASKTTASVVAFFAAGQPVWTPRNYEQLAKQGYETNATVYACVNAIAHAISGLDWLLFERRRRGEQELEEHAVLALLARPNPFEGRTFFFSKLAGYLMLAGNSYLEAVAPNRPNAMPRELYCLRPDRMRVLPDVRERIGGFEWEHQGVRARFRADEVLHTKLFHPTHDWYGLSPIEAAARSVDVDNASLTSNMKFLQNGFRPSGALTVDGNLGDDVFTRLKADVQAQYGGAERSGLPLLLEGGMKWQDMSLSPKDLDYLAGRKMSQLDVCRAYSVPPELVNLKEGTFENRKEARKALYTEAVLPVADLLRDELNTWLVPRYGDRLRLDYDRDAIQALQEDRKALWERVRQADSLTVNEKRVAMGYDAIPDGDVVLVPASVIPLALAGDTGADFEEMPGDAEPDELDAMEGVAGDQDRGAAQKAVATMADPRRAHLWTKQALEFLPIERRYHAALRRYFAQQAREVLGRLRRLNRLEAGIVLETKDMEEILFEVDAETGTLREVARPYYDEAIRRGGHAVELELGAEGQFSPEAAAPAQRLTALLDNLRGIVTRVRTYLRGIIEGALHDPEGAPSIDEIAQRLKDAYAGLGESRARTIARTETARAYNDGRMSAFEQLGVEEIEWLSARDEAVRTSPFNHAIDGERRQRGQPFSNGLRWPHAPEGSAANVVNCRCVVLPVLRGL